MSQLNWRIFHTVYAPPDYTANSVDAVMNVESGYVIGPIFARTNVAFDGTNSDAVFELGDGNNVDEYIDAGELDEHTAGDRCLAVGASDGSYDTTRMALYESADTIDVNFTADTGGDGAAGEVEIWICWARIFGA